MIGFIRYNKSEKALAFIDVEKFSEKLLQSEYSKLNDSQKKEFQAAVSKYIVNKSFPVAQKYFDKVDLTFEKETKKGKETTVPASLLYKGSQKIKFAWIMEEKSGKFLVTDFLMDGKRISDVNREQQLLPLLKKEGFESMVKKLNKASD